MSKSVLIRELTKEDEPTIRKIFANATSETIKDGFFHILLYRPPLWLKLIVAMIYSIFLFLIPNSYVSFAIYTTIYFSIYSILIPTILGHWFSYCGLREPDIKNMYANFIEKPKTCMFVATVNSEIVGMIGVRPTDASKKGFFYGLRKENDAEIHKLNVDSKYRGLNISTLLLDQAKRFALDNGFNRLILTTADGYRVAYFFVYPKYGFKLIKEVHHMGLAHVGFFALDITSGKK